MIVIFLQLFNFHRCVGVHTSIYNVRVWNVFRTAPHVVRCLVGTNVTGTCLRLYSLFTYLFICLFIYLCNDTLSSSADTDRTIRLIN